MSDHLSEARMPLSLSRQIFQAKDVLVKETMERQRIILVVSECIVSAVCTSKSMLPKPVITKEIDDQLLDTTEVPLM